MKQSPLSTGISIIELLIVLTVSSIISFIAIPSYNSIQEVAKNTSIKQQAHSIQIALETYFLSTGSYPNGTSIESVISQLIESNILKNIPINPFTKQAPSDSDQSGLIH